MLATSRSTHSDIAALNFNFLVQFRALHAISTAEAMLRFNFTADEADRVVAMSHEDLKALASDGIMQFQIKLPQASLSQVSRAH